MKYPVPTYVDGSTQAQQASPLVHQENGKLARGFLIVNADDWGQNSSTTDRILECSTRGTVSSVSAMMFMEDSDRAADIALERQIETGLHLNFTVALTSPGCPLKLSGHLQHLARHLLRHRFSQLIFHPVLINSFEYVVAAQLDEFRRLYGVNPNKLDGHHHMHLCMNVLLQRLLPPGTIVRRNFSFDRGERNLINRFYRKTVDRGLALRHRLVDFFFSLPPFEPPDRLEQIYSLARKFVIELETHPVRPEEHRYLAGGEIFRHIRDIRIASPSAMNNRESALENPL